MKPFVFGGVVIFLLLSSCVIVPVPFFETKDEFVWSDEGRNGGAKNSIKAEVKQWYLPIPVSPEGPSKLPRGKAEYRYFMGNDTVDHEGRTHWSNLVELPWLELKVDDTNGWRQTIALEGTPYWLAFRLVESDQPKKIDEVTGLPWREFEIVVFSRVALKTKGTITAVDWPGFADDKYAKWKYDQARQTLEYLSPTGPRRYHLLVGVEVPVNSK